ncbi:MULTISPECIES: 2-dehydropantoate 2-reductase [Ramlibacter]|uniref:2-dehydropantoate 2-reductase n=1 Tax=Ramlibacter aquaticus TaxID=2780094 RepID=A0ABR9SIZ9_9BURK|nr:MULTISPECIES: 2-dehydropantoate 2-reductase [Ramlibacter]MBE7942325.1 2-dehydropantoate 2-reductase [Ramlibacter aquaticus]
MRIAIMGSGGVGAYVGARLQAAGEEVGFIARGAHLAALRESGLRLETPEEPLHLPQVTATDDPAALAPADVVLFCVKLWDTADAARQLRGLVGPETRVITLQNGIDSVDMVTEALGGVGRVLGGCIYVSAVIDRPGVIRSPGGFHRIVVDAAGGDPVVAAFVQACGRARALECEATDDIAAALWQKFIGLAGVSSTTSLMRAPMGRILSHPESAAFQRQLFEEGIALARASGVHIADGMADTMMGMVAKMPPSFRSSMSEDLERGKPLELPWLAGRMHRLGLAHGVPTPAYSAAYRGLVVHERGAAAG